MVGIASILVYLSTQTTILAWSPRQVANTTSLLPANITSAAAESASSILTSISASSAAASPAIASESSQASSDSAASPVPTGQAPPVTSGGGEYNASLVQSPPYPYPLDSSLDGNSYYISPRWSAAHQKARDYLSGWTQEEKVNLTTGVGWQVGRCVGNIPAIPSQGFPGLCLEDSPLGVRFADHVSAFPAGINVASTFDKDLMYARGYAMAEEFKGKGVHIALGPMTNMARVAAGGRNWEGFGGDPYLAGWATEMTIKGMQDAGVQACVKHYIGNEQERNRTTSSSNIDDRTMREIYTHPFLRAVAADVASVMCAYNLINNSWACQNEYTQNGILKTDFGFQGYILSDWQATESGVSSVNAGLDMTMPGDVVFFSRTSYFGQNLTTAVNNGSVASARLDDMAERILAGWFLLEQDQDFPEVNFDAFRRNSTANNSFVDVRSNHDEVIRHIGAASTVLLKNTGSLPLHKPKSIALIGSDAGPSMFGPNGCEDRGCDYGTLAMGWGSGTADFPYLIDPYTAISLQARHDHSTFDWTFDNFDLEAAQERAGGVEVAIVAIHADSGEQYITFDGNEGDRNNLTAWRGGDDLVNAVAAVNNNTIVVVHAVGPIVLEAWIDHPNVTGVLWAGLPGQESGNSLVDVMYGSYNPSGRLPYTIAKRREDYSADIIYVNTDVPATPQVDYTEGLDIDYRHFLSKDIEPRFGFGFGLSYTKFNYTNLQLYGEGVSKRDNEDPFSVNSTTTYNSTAPSNSTAPYNSTTAGVTNSTAGSHNGTTSPVSPTGQNGTTLGSGGQVVKVGRFMSDWLQRPRWTVTVDVQNVGPVDGCNVPQLYLEYPEGSGEPPRVLRDFARINLQPWQAEQVKWTLSQYDISIWDVVSQDWIVPEGEFGIVVADNAFDKGLRVPFCPWGKC